MTASVNIAEPVHSSTFISWTSSPTCLFGVDGVFIEVLVNVGAVVVGVVGADFEAKLVGTGCGIVVVMVVVAGIAPAVRFAAMACTTFAILSSLNLCATRV